MTSARALALVVPFVLFACGKVKDPTPKGTTLVEWDRSNARGYDAKDPTKPGPPHPLASAKILEGPEKHGYSVTVGDEETKRFSVDVDVDAAKVSYPEDGVDTTRWATTHIAIKVADNDAFHLHAHCDPTVATVMGAIGEVTNTVVDCSIGGKRPNSMGDTDAISIGTLLQIEGSGKILSVNDPAVTVKER